MADKILVVEDDPAICELIALHLRDSGFEVVAASRGGEGLDLARRLCPRLILLDLMLPDMDGMDVCRRLKKEGRTASIPVVMLTARGEEIDRVLGFELGADDYVTKPFSPRELVLRVKRVLERSSGKTEKPSPFVCEPLEVDPARPSVKVYGKGVELTALEIKLLCHLYDHRGRVQTRDRLLDHVWGYNSPVNTRTVDTHVKRLREKLGKAGFVIQTVRGLGYRFKEDT